MGMAVVTVRMPMTMPVIVMDVVVMIMIMSLVRCAGSIMFHSRGLPSIDRRFAGA